MNVAMLHIHPCVSALDSDLQHRLYCNYTAIGLEFLSAEQRVQSHFPHLRMTYAPNQLNVIDKNQLSGEQRLHNIPPHSHHTHCDSLIILINRRPLTMKMFHYTSFTFPQWAFFPKALQRYILGSVQIELNLGLRDLQNGGQFVNMKIFKVSMAIPLNDFNVNKLLTHFYNPFFFFAVVVIEAFKCFYI